MSWFARSDRKTPFVLERIAGLLRPDPVWVQAFAELTGVSRGSFVLYLSRLDRARELAAELTTSGRTRHGLLSMARRTAEVDSHALLGETSLTFTRSAGDVIQLEYGELQRRDPGLVWVLRGDNPELRPAIRAALAETRSDDWILRCSRLAWDLLPVPVADLHPLAMPDVGSSEVRSALVRMVEYVDRSGVMGPFLAACATELPRSRRLDEVVRAFEIWDAAHRLTLEALHESLRDGR
jgi:hypothetical protein